MSTRVDETGVSHEQSGESFPARVLSSLAALAERPVLLVLVALCANALATPYMGILHDARLYGLQTSNRAHHGAFTHDLFLFHDSQDRYTLFAPLTAPLASSLGLPLAFFLIYLVSKTILVVGALRLAFRLFGPSAASSLAVIVVATAPIPYSVFVVNEPFTTPRLATCGLILLALSYLVDSRWVCAGALLSAGALLHPLMALPGLSILAGWLVICWWPRWGLVVLCALALLLVATLLVAPGLGQRVFGAMESEWFEQVGMVSGFLDPWRWSGGTWVQLLIAGTSVVLVALVLYSKAVRVSRFLLLTLLVGMTGLVVTLLACVFNYQLLLQVQLYRMLWCVQVLAILCSIQLAFWAWREERHLRSAGAMLLVALLLCPDHWNLLVLASGLFVILSILFRGLRQTPRQPHWISQAVLVSLLAAEILCGLIKFVNSLNHLTEGRSLLAQSEITYLMWLQFGSVLFLVPVGVFLGRGTHHIRFRPWRVGTASLALWLFVQASMFAYSCSTRFGDYFFYRETNLLFVQSVLNSHRKQEAVPTVYWPRLPLDLYYLRLHCCSYFQIVQMSGICFSPVTSSEVFRRAQLVGPFEMDCYRHVSHLLSEPEQRVYPQLYHVPLNGPCPSRADLDRLAQDPKLHYIVLTQDLGTPRLASNGSVYVYDCAELRAAFGKR